jgi:hypothetical protein
LQQVLADDRQRLGSGQHGARVDLLDQRPDQGWYCPEFGKALPQDVLVLTVDRNNARPFGYRIRRETASA